MERSRVLDAIGGLAVVGLICALVFMLGFAQQSLHTAKVELITQQNTAQTAQKTIQQLQAQNASQVRTLATLHADLAVNRRTTAELAQQNAALAARSP